MKLAESGDYSGARAAVLNARASVFEQLGMAYLAAGSDDVTKASEEFLDANNETWREIGEMINRREAETEASQEEEARGQASGDRLRRSIRDLNAAAISYVFGPDAEPASGDA